MTDGRTATWIPTNIFLSWGENPELLFFPLTIPDPRKT